jgi:DNA mismatch repair ATPase MutS
VNLAINETYGRKITPYFGGLSQIHRLLRVAERLTTLPDVHLLPQLSDLRETAPVRSLLRERLGWLVRNREDMDEFLQVLIGFINLILLVDIQVYLGSLTSLRRHQSDLLKMLEAVGSLDASISVASFMDGLTLVAVPSRTEERRIEAVGLYHPLLADPVGNPIHCHGRSILITGSNMAGKTTFLRTVGINVILAQTLNLCLAESATIPKSIVRSSIRREDRLARGESFYAVEVARIQEMIQDAASDHLHLFLLDEIFRGTNTLERISAAAAVLHHLGMAHLAMVTTHDLELQELLADGYDMHHFSEQIVDGRHGFNYHIQSGPTTGRNAIRLLELNGYPDSIIREARKMADQLVFRSSQ